MILVFNTKGLFIGQTKTLTAAGKLTGCDLGNISKILKGELNQSRGFTFVKDNNPIKDKLKYMSNIATFFEERSMSLREYLSKEKNELKQNENRITQIQYRFDL